MRRLAFLPALALLTAACLGSDFADSLEGSWQLNSGTVDGVDIPIADDHPITLDINGDQLSGNSSCNTYGGDFELSGSQVTIGNLFMTDMACLDDEVMQTEATYLGALARVDSVELDSDLTLSGADIELVFERLEPASTAELTNAVWVLDGLIDEDTVSSPDPDTRAQIEFFTDGAVLGYTGCRHFTGRFIVSGAEIDLPELGADDRVCEPPHLADQDRHFFTVIGDGFRAEVEGGRLTAWSRGGIGLIFVAQS